MNKSIKSQQGGFTLIELIVVIVILGILAATALPRFASLSGEARAASLNAARSAMNATSAMTHGSWLVTRAAIINVEGINVTMNPVSGYPVVTTATQARNFATASGLNAADYTMFLEGAGDDRPTVAANQVAFVPNSVVNTPTAVNCFVRYTAAPAAINSVPVYAVGRAGRDAAEMAQDCE